MNEVKKCSNNNPKKESGGPGTIGNTEPIKPNISKKIDIIITNVNDAPESDPGNYTTEEELPVEITHIGRDKDVLDIFQYFALHWYIHPLSVVSSV